MPVFLLALLLLILASTNIEGLMQWAQTSCQLSLGPSTALTKALVCGVRLPAGASKDWLLNWGLIHLFVVSGAHFLFLEHHLRSLLTRPTLLKPLFVPLLLLYALATGGGPPVLRSGLGLILHFMNERWSYRWSSSQVVLLAGLLCFILVPHEQYLSLQLSWAAALLLTVYCAPPFAAVKKAFVLWWGLLPLLSGLTWSHPFSIVSNLIVTPLFQTLLFPLVWIDQMLMQLKLHTLLEALVKQMIPYSLSPLSSASQDTQFKWIYLFALQIFCLLLQRRKREDRLVKSSFFTYPQ